ncbi:MAG: cytochrome-c peroxidase [Ferruginibacter sp.]|nr:cytochrome-c peroxidase [Ferruginibacter sp.]
MKFLFITIFISILVSLIAFSFKPEKITAYSKASLGKKLFSEKILSLDSSVSCASCHIPKFAFADTLAFSIGIGGKETGRNTPSVLNMKNRPYYFYDGRAETLHEQALMPIANKDEMGLPIADAVERLNKNNAYRKLFLQTFKQLPTAKNLGEAFAAFEQTLETVNSKFDDWSNNKATLSKAEERGRVLFTGDKAKCFDCHSMEDFTDDSFKNIGLFNGNFLTDSGRYLITKNTNDLGKFKTTGLRNVAVTAPYMHNGMFATLEEVLRYYNNPKGFFPHQINLDTTFKNGLNLTAKEQADIISFLKTLTDKAYVKK